MPVTAFGSSAAGQLAGGRTRIGLVYLGDALVVCGY
jgi:hypothetical protein